MQVPKSFTDDLGPDDYLIIQTGYHQHFEASKITKFLENFTNRNRTSSVNFLVVVKYLYNDQLVVVNSRCKNGRLQRVIGRCKKVDSL